MYISTLKDLSDAKGTPGLLRSAPILWNLFFSYKKNVKINMSHISYAGPLIAHWGSHLLETPGNKVTQNGGF